MAKSAFQNNTAPKMLHNVFLPNFPQIDAHEDDVNTVCFADDSPNIIFSGADDGLCKVWDRRMLGDNSTTPVGTLAGHTDGIAHIDTKVRSR